MKVSVPKDFGNTSKKPVLPLVPEPIKSIKKEDLAAVNLCSDPGDHNSAQVKFAFKGLDGDHETPREILQWRHNVDRALTGLDLNANGLSSYNMCKQFMRGSTLSSFIAKAGAILVNRKAKAIVTAEQTRDNYPAATKPGHIVADFNALRAAACLHLTKKSRPTFWAQIGRDQDQKKSRPVFATSRRPSLFFFHHILVATTTKKEVIFSPSKHLAFYCSDQVISR